MKRHSPALGLAVIAFAGLTAAHGSAGLANDDAPARAARPDKPYALWDATSQVVPGTEVRFDGRDGVVDTAPLVPHALYGVDQDLVEGTRVWLPKGGLLVKMGGGAGNWFCTWRFDDKANQSQTEAASERLNKLEHLLCLQADASGKMTTAKIMITHLKGAMIVNDPDSGMGKYRNGVGDTNAVTLVPVANDALPKRLQLQIFAAWTSSLGGSVCFHSILADMKGNEFVKQNGDACARPGQSVTIAGGRYTIASIAGDNNFKIRIDRPIDVRSMTPDIRIVHY